jgi:hypothetical protein
MKFYLAIKKNDKWIELENKILSEVSQVQKVKDHMFTLIGGI